MRDAAGEARPILAQDRNEILVRVALMQEHRLAQLDGELQLLAKRCQLRLARREIAEVIEPAFADGDDFRLPRQRRAVPAAALSSSSAA